MPPCCFSLYLQLGDLWYFNQTTSKWLEKKTFVHAKYADSCDDDFICHETDYIQYYADYRHPDNNGVAWVKDKQTVASLPPNICQGTMVPKFGTNIREVPNGTRTGYGYNRTHPTERGAPYQYNVTKNISEHYTFWEER